MPIVKVPINQVQYSSQSNCEHDCCAIHQNQLCNLLLFPPLTLQCSGWNFIKYSNPSPAVRQCAVFFLHSCPRGYTLEKKSQVVGTIKRAIGQKNYTYILHPESNLSEELYTYILMLPPLMLLRQYYPLR